MIASKTGHANAKSAVKAQIDENLRRVYDEVLIEAVPDRFTQLLAQLKALEPADPPKTTGQNPSAAQGIQAANDPELEK